VKPAAWFVNAALRTCKGFFPALARPDDRFAAAWLPPCEYALYERMDVRERDHACQVARMVLASEPSAAAVVVRAALLHDVGKSGVPYDTWLRIGMHLYPAQRRPGADDRHQPPAAATSPLRTVGWLQRLAAARRWNDDHAERGAAMIVAAGGDRDVAALVRHHHDPDGPAASRLIGSIDERT